MVCFVQISISVSSRRCWRLQRRDFSWRMIQEKWRWPKLDNCWSLLKKRRGRRFFFCDVFFFVKSGRFFLGHVSVKIVSFFLVSFGRLGWRWFFFKKLVGFLQKWWEMGIFDVHGFFLWVSRKALEWHLQMGAHAAITKNNGFSNRKGQWLVTDGDQWLMRIQQPQMKLGDYTSSGSWDDIGCLLWGLPSAWQRNRNGRMEDLRVKWW